MYYEHSGIKIYYEKFNRLKSRTILILPGWGDTRNTFSNIINYFKNDYSIYIIDYPSFGNSPIPKFSLNIYDYAKLIMNFMNDNNIINPIIIAHSFGGRIATILTGLYNLKIDKMVFMDVAGIKPKKTLKSFIKEKIYKLLKNICKLFKKTKDEKINKLNKIFASTDYNNLTKEMHKTFINIVNEDLKNYYKNINSEVLLIWGKNDIDTPLKDGIYINNSIKNSELIIFDKGTHFTYLQYPYDINLILDSFINEK